MRIFRFLVVVCGILLLLTACNRDGMGNGDSESSSSARSVSREGKTSTGAMMDDASSSAKSASSRRSSSSSRESVVVGSSASSLSGRSSSVSSTRAPFFSLQSSSLSSVTVMELGSSSARATVTAGRIKVHLDADRGEARSGDQVLYSVTVKNLTERAVREADVVFSFSPAQLAVLETDGSVLGGNIRWEIKDLQGGEKRVIKVRAAISSGLVHGEVIRANAVATVDGVVEPQTGLSSLTIIDRLPATGLSDFTGPLENTRRFLTPFGRSASGAAIPSIVWGATLAMGLALGGRAMKRYL